MANRRFVKVACLVSACLVATAEIGVRLSGVMDFPLYAVDAGIGYVPKPNQSGKFLNKNAWVFNDRSMGTQREWKPSGKPNLLLIGNSIVMGGNPYDQAEKLGPLLQKELGDKAAVWPIAAGGWSNVNQSVYLRRNPDVIQANNFFVWFYMNGGFSRLSRDRGHYVFPTEKPSFATWYVVRRYVLPRFIEFNMDELPPKGKSSRENLKEFEALVAEMASSNGRAHPGVVVFYPGRDEYIGMQKGVDYVADRTELERVASTRGVTIVDIAKRPEWRLALYRDDPHPTAEGNRVLADILAAEFRKIF